MNKEDSKDLKEKQSWSLEKKIQHAHDVIDSFYEKMNGKVYVAFSGGKDSTVLLHLVREWMKKTRPNVDIIPAVFSNTSNEQIQLLKFVKTVDNVITINPKTTFLETIKKYGFPLVSKKVSRMIYDLRNEHAGNKNICNLYRTGYNMKKQFCKSYILPKKWYPLIDAPFSVTNKCCNELKHKPFYKFEKESGLRGFIGTMAEESQLRKLNYVTYGCNLITKKEQKSRPLSIWLEQDIWDYIHKYNVPYCEVYDDQIINGEVVKGEERTGCAYCGFGVHLEKGDQNRFYKLYKREPKRYKHVMDNLGFRYALKYIGIKLPDDDEYNSKDYPTIINAYRNNGKTEEMLLKEKTEKEENKKNKKLNKTNEKTKKE